VNARLSRTPGSNPPFSALQSFIVGTFCCFVVTLIWSGGFHGIDVKLAFHEGPWWQWMGGFLGATVLVVNILEVPRLGAGTVSAVLVSSFVIFVSGALRAADFSLVLLISLRWSVCSNGTLLPGGDWVSLDSLVWRRCLN
jgi:uncharacterized membrane protein YdcZ (DUF606 family)